MIRRNYAYSITIYGEDRHIFSCGIISHKSWLPESAKAFRFAMDRTKESAAGCTDDQIHVQYFAKV